MEALITPLRLVSLKTKCLLGKIPEIIVDKTYTINKIVLEIIMVGKIMALAVIIIIKKEIQFKTIKFPLVKIRIKFSPNQINKKQFHNSSNNNNKMIKIVMKKFHLK